MTKEEALTLTPGDRLFYQHPDWIRKRGEIEVVRIEDRRRVEIFYKWPQIHNCPEQEWPAYPAQVSLIPSPSDSTRS